MRILITVTGAWGTGSFQVASGVASALRELGHEVRLFFPDSGVDSSDKAYYYSHPELYEIWHFPIADEHACLETFPLMLPDPNPRSPNAKTFSQLSEAERELYFRALKQKLGSVIETFKPDVIECEHIWAMDYVVSELKYPFISVAHNSDQIAYDFDPSMHVITKESAERARYIFAVSKRVKDRVVRTYQVDANKVIVIPCGVDQDVFKPMSIDRQTIQRDFGLMIPASAKLVAFSGKMSRTKGVDILLETNRYLQEKNNIHLLLLGSGNINDVLSEEERLACAFENVHFLGHRSLEEVAIINNVADVSVVPSRSEGFCISGLEAIACGTPIIVTESAYVAAYEAAAIVPDENPRALAEAILKVLALPKEERETLKQQALQSAENLSWPRIAKQRIGYYTALQS